MSDIESFICGVCEGANVDDSQVVECERCKTKFHKHCVVVNENVLSWKCEKCNTLSVPLAPKTNRSKSVRSRASSSMSQKLALQKLQEEERLQMELLQESLNEKARIQKEFLQKRYDILQQEGSQASGSTISSRKKVQSWIDENIVITSSSQPVLSSTVLNSKATNVNVSGEDSVVITSCYQADNTAPVLASTVLNTKATNVNVSEESSAVITSSYQTDNAAITGRDEKGVKDLDSRPLELRTTNAYLTPIVSSSVASAQATFTAPFIPMTQTKAAASNSVLFAANYTPPNMTKSGLTLNHHEISKPALAARQVVPKDLPTFSGKPSEWPEFIAAYEFTSDVCEISEYENAGRLQKSLSGIALEAVRSRLYLPDGASYAIQTLRKLFGQPEFVINELLQQLRQSSKPNADDLNSIIHYSLKVENLCASMKKASLIQHLSNPILLQELSGYLPTSLMYEWAQHKYRLEMCDVEAFSSWLRERTDALLCILQRAPLQAEHIQSMEHLNVHQEPVVSHGNCKICSGNCSATVNCKSFNEEPLSKRWILVKSIGLCRSCLKSHKGSCRYKEKCGIGGCEYLHHKLLHNYGNSKNTTSSQTEGNVNFHKEPRNKTYFKIVPIRLSRKDRTVTTYAILDDCSSLTMLEQSVADSLGISGLTLPLQLKWTGNTTRIEPTSQLVGVEVSGVDLSKSFKLDRVRTVSNLNLPSQTQSADELQKYSHLHGISLPLFHNAVPQMLIGLPHAKLLSPSKVKIGNDGEPAAAKTPLGWVVYGSTDDNHNRVLHINEQECVPDSVLDEEVIKYFALESLGVTLRHSDILSGEEQRALNIMEKTTKFHGTFYETGLLWKYQNISLPNSYEMARNRLNHLQTKLEKEPELGRVVESLIQEYLEKGYARKLSSDELTEVGNKSWYLPTFIVRNPNKPQKIRLVWDAAAKTRNVSLNSMLLKGPDTLLSLPGILRRFRENKIAFTGDIREMFHQVHIRKVDQHYQRFLWRFGNDQEPTVLCMNVMTFGATCSPACANYVLNLNADRFQNEYPEAVQSIHQSHYVDDLLEGRYSEEDAIQLAKDIRFIHKSGGFEIRNWSSNSKVFLKALTDSTSFDENHVELKPDSNMEKVLGLWWNTSTDNFTFLLKYNKSNAFIMNGSVVPSKRDVLRTLMSIFDPLGLLSHILIYPRILLQDLWRFGVSWDEPIPEDVFTQWKLWIDNLQFIENINIPRFYEIHVGSSIELHTFVDASEEAFSCAVYIRITELENIRCVLVSAKSKVAPLKPLSMPRLELQAALIGARMASSVKADQNFKISKEYYWSDSITVLSWLRSDARRYRQFVAVRVGEILELTKASDWRWVPTKLNVADLATRKVVQIISARSSWFNGPDFLYEPENTWPQHKYKNLETEEIRTQYLTEEEPPHVNFHMESIVNTAERSNWCRVLRAQAYVFRFIHNCKVKGGVSKDQLRCGPLLRCEYVAAQNHLFRSCQSEGYPEEIACLIKVPAVSVPKTSPVYKDAPYIDDAGVMRANSRLVNGKGISEDVQRPIILPKKNKITELLLFYYHTKYHHLNTETAVNEIRQHYIIPTLRVLMKSISHKCQYCKNRRARPYTPFMANLPDARLGTVTKPFSFIGIDYFGPILVKVKRSQEKRWGVIITCLSIRAIHIEIASTLTTDSCMMSIQRFICRRGTPLEIYSDNGRNFRGASKELQTALSFMNEQALAEKFTSESTQWFFNPPSAPHMGGVWERLVRSIKVTLAEIQPTRTPTEELLRTMMLEVENIVNSRPLTYVPLDSDLEEAITPNHFLLGSSNGKKPRGTFSSNVWILKNNWKKSEEYSNKIWRKWRKEYLPELRRRQTFNNHYPNIKVGDVAILCDDDVPKNHWPKATVLATYPSNDGRIRRVTIKTEKGVYDRPVSKLAVLDVNSTDSTSIDAIEVPGKTVERAAPTSINSNSSPNTDQ